MSASYLLDEHTGLHGSRLSAHGCVMAYIHGVWRLQLCYQIDLIINDIFLTFHSQPLALTKDCSSKRGIVSARTGNHYYCPRVVSVANVSPNKRSIDCTCSASLIAIILISLPRNDAISVLFLALLHEVHADLA